MKITLAATAAVLSLALAASGSGCAWKSRKVTGLESQVKDLEGRLARAEADRDALSGSVEDARVEARRAQEQRAQEVERLMREKEEAVHETKQEVSREADEMVLAERQLAESLKKELGDARAKLAMTERGLVLTFLDEIFFDSGKAQVKPDGMETLDKVASVLKETVPDSPVAVEGHTDDEPIKHSGWKSNWELSSARALAVVHHFVGQQGVSPDRLQAVGFGEYRPLSSNETAEGRRQNRRVEVVILPKQLKKVRD